VRVKDDTRSFSDSLATKKSSYWRGLRERERERGGREREEEKEVEAKRERMRGGQI